MNFMIATGAALVLLSGNVLADESMTRATPSKHQMMKECVEKQKTADVTMSKAAMDRFCKDEVKRRLAGDSPQPPSDPPRAP